MIAPEKKTLLDWMVYRSIRLKLRLQFRDVKVRGLVYFQRLPHDRPVIVFSNHSNWWDALLVFLLARSARHKDFYCMMEEQQLRNYPYLPLVGAFSIDLLNPLRAAGAVRYAVRLLQKRTTLLWVFPQGDMAPPRLPLDIRTGANYLATQANGAQMVPVAFRYEFFSEDKPHVLIEIGEPFPAHESSDERIAARCIEINKQLDRVIMTQNLEGFEDLIPPQHSLLSRLNPLLSALRARIARLFPDEEPASPQPPQSAVRQRDVAPANKS